MDIRIPSLAEGVESATVVGIRVKAGDMVTKGQTLIELETAKAVGSVPSPAAGRVSRVAVQEGEDVRIGQVVIALEENGGETSASSAPDHLAPPAGPAPQAPSRRAATDVAPPARDTREAQAQRPRREAPAGQTQHEQVPAGPAASLPAGIPVAASPSLRRLLRDLGIDAGRIRGTGPGGRIELQDLRDYIQGLQSQAPAGVAGA
jgi:pyruvate dehydrogenase E2 component (dihydrolipoamide acetyltransferase)